ncbi:MULTISPECIES: cobyrinic acid a,c-diamide synthase [unclassified Coleofasciculus]|uniref:cobyrinic acid a,c-diamide synthase n=1 Tax=unclassified Coleofasciculus TaxID=2692782 RepID=UPI0018807BE1|nr:MULTISPECIES: cobyrinic acid a,c-diamide synthase [unclassified Coleofasciculus]MBE9127188.1 cobyrinic acid a,c-diamide synthase [Coleofasciculus sp. LEGE 07081]MBE9150298.1 cobyrinic acid a,c-diamide synthase [Coleofasciculus sp. LEGE 07092]
MQGVEREFRSNLEEIKAISALEKITLTVRKIADKIPLERRMHILSLCYLTCAAPTEKQEGFAKSLDDYVADHLVEILLRERTVQRIASYYLKNFRIYKRLTRISLKVYIKHFYFHSFQNSHTEPDSYLEFILRLLHNSGLRINFCSYILGFEVIKMMFEMSWLQHERFYQLQKNQEIFIDTYIKPIQQAHRVNGIIVPKHENVFFARRDYFIQRPHISEEKLVALVQSTFSKEAVTNLGFSIIRNLNSLAFDYDYIFNSDPEVIFVV